MTTSGKPKAYHHGNLREGLLAAAEDLLARHGLAGISLREVAKAAGVSHAAPYHHFSSLDDLLAAVAERAFLRLADAMEAEMAEADAHERLLRIGEAYVAFALAAPAPFKLMFGPTLATKDEHPALKLAADRAFGVLVAAAGAHAPEEGPALALTGWSLAHGIASLAIDGAYANLPISVPAPAVLVRSMLFRLLGARPR